MRRATVADLDECQQRVSIEEKEDEDMRRKFRNRWTLVSMTDTVKQLESKMAGYKDNLKVGGRGQANSSSCAGTLAVVRWV